MRQAKAILNNCYFARFFRRYENKNPHICPICCGFYFLCFSSSNKISNYSRYPKDLTVCLVNAYKESFYFLGFSFCLRQSRKSGKLYPHVEPSAFNFTPTPITLRPQLLYSDPNYSDPNYSRPQLLDPNYSLWDYGKSCICSAWNCVSPGLRSVDFPTDCAWLPFLPIVQAGDQGYDGGIRIGTTTNPVNGTTPSHEISALPACLFSSQ